jgi:hypothetical protein
MSGGVKVWPCLKLQFLELWQLSLTLTFSCTAIMAFPDTERSSARTASGTKRQRYIGFLLVVVLSTI